MTATHQMIPKNEYNTNVRSEIVAMTVYLNQVLELLEEIDDDLDELDVLLVKINEATVASDFGIEDRPCLVIFEKGQ